MHFAIKSYTEKTYVSESVFNIRIKQIRIEYASQDCYIKSVSKICAMGGRYSSGQQLHSLTTSVHSSTPRMATGRGVLLAADRCGLKLRSSRLDFSQKYAQN